MSIIEDNEVLHVLNEDVEMNEIEEINEEIDDDVENEEDDEEDDDEEEDDVVEESVGIENYQTVNGVSIYFNFLEGLDTVSGLLCINNIVQKPIFTEEQINDAIHLWSDEQDIINLLAKQGYALTVTNVEKFEKLAHNNADMFLINSDKHYFVIKKLKGFYFLLNPTHKSPTVFDNNLVKYLNSLKAKNGKKLITYEVKISNSIISINKIEMNGELHNENYGKLLIINYYSTSFNNYFH